MLSRSVQAFLTVFHVSDSDIFNRQYCYFHHLIINNCMMHACANQILSLAVLFLGYGLQDVGQGIREALEG